MKVYCYQPIRPCVSPSMEGTFLGLEDAMVFCSLTEKALPVIKFSNFEGQGK